MKRFHFGVRCCSCGLVFIDPQPSTETIAEMYSEAYFTVCSETCGAHGPATYMEMAAAGAAERSRSAIELDAQLRGVLGGGPGRLLEVGCGPGFFLAAMRELGWEARGLEISSFGVRHAREELALDVVQGQVDPAHFEPSSFEAVFLGDVLEHLPRPLESLQILRGFLRPGGVIAVAVPSTLNLLSARIGMGIFRWRRRFKTLTIPPYHLFEYTPRTLSRMMAVAGFEMRGIRQSTVPVGRMGLRGSRLEIAGKVSLQYLAQATAQLLNRGGDRLLATAVRPDRS